MFRYTVRARACALAIASATLVATTSPGAATASTVNCNIPQPCALYSNANNYGVEGVSAKTSGVVGITTFNATSASNATAALKGNDSSTNNNPYNSGFYGFSAYGFGGKGKTYHGTGIYGTATQGNGVLGDTSAPSSLGTHYGILGVDDATDGGFNDGVFGSVTNGGYGVEGTSTDGAYGGVHGVGTNGIGVRGQSTATYGVFGSSTSGIGVDGSSSSSYGVYGASGSVAGVYGTSVGVGVQGVSTSNVGLFGTSSSGFAVEGLSQSSLGGFFSSASGTALEASAASGTALYAATQGTGSGSVVGALVRNNNGNGADINGSYIGAVARSDSFPLVATNAAGTNAFYVDGAGNGTFSGNLQIHGTYGTFAVTRTGRTARSYTPRSTTPSVEDAGAAQLVNGVANVRLDPTFAASIDLASPYHVFLTPGGDTRGLYIASKTATGFVVRETQGGRGTLAFDYRILAAEAGHPRDRMSFVTEAETRAPSAPVVESRPAKPALAATPKAAKISPKLQATLPRR